ncbi:helix-turn-helix transcriptional regulator [Amedibacillus sp. YH-ame6]
MKGVGSLREWLIECRKNKGLSKSQVAELVGVQCSVIGKYERGERRPSPEVAKKLGKLLKFNWTKFYS